MFWQSETYAQAKKRWKNGVRCFALFPHMMQDGTIVWLEHYWSVLYDRSRRIEWRNYHKQEDIVLQADIPRPPPPSFRSSVIAPPTKETNNG